MGYTFYSYLIMLSDNSDATLEKLKNMLEDIYSKDDRNIKISLDQNCITLTIDNWNLYIGYSSESHVINESREISEQFAEGMPEQSTIAKCKARFEMSANPDPDMSFFNDSCFVQERIESFNEVFIFDTNESTFTNI